MGNNNNIVGNEDPPLGSWCRTEVKFRYAWKLEKFSEMCKTKKNGEYFSSSMFTMKGPDDKETNWKITLYPKGNKSENSDYLSVFLYNESKADVTVAVDFSLLDHHKIPGLHSSSNIVFNGTPNWGWGQPKFVKLKALKKHSSVWIPKDSLTLICDITIIGVKEPVAVVAESKYVNGEVHTEKTGQLCDDLEFALSDKEYSDVELKCGDQIFDCHQVILSARSPVFRTMFQVDMKERKNKKVDVINFEPDVVSEMLSFIYTGKTPRKLEELAEDLLAAAEQYQLVMLKKLCEDSLCKSLNVDNCVSRLVIGDMHQAGKLKRMSLKVIASNRKSVFESKERKELLKNHPNLMMEVLEEMN